MQQSDPGQTGLGMADADGRKDPGFGSRIGKGADPASRRFSRSRIGSVRHRGRPASRAMISPSSADRGTARSLATTTMGGTASPGGSVRRVMIQGRPGNQGGLSV